MSCFVTFEGPEGSGKSTQIALLREFLAARGVPAVFTREPGGTPIGEAIRDVLHDVRHTAMVPETEILLYSASRAQHVSELIRPALAKGQLVICDRFAESTLAYQGYGRGLDLEALRRITAFATGGLVPDLVLYLDLDVQEGLARKRRARQDGCGEWNRLDQEEVAFHQRVREGYLHLAAADPGRWRVLDASQPVEQVHEAVVQHVIALLAQTSDRRPAGGGRTASTTQ